MFGKYKKNKPITSYGIILFTLDKEKIPKFLMIRRKNTFGYIDFIKGLYHVSNDFYIQKIINEMTLEEKDHLLHHEFKDLWKQLWNYSSCDEFITNAIYLKCNHKFTQIYPKLFHFIEQSKTKWEETEWEFPKGRLNVNEKHLECSLREFEEETGISKYDIHVIKNLLPFEEYFMGSNYRMYSYKYYLAYMEPNVFETCDLEHFQTSEIGKLEWVNLSECLIKIRPYNKEKKKLIQNIYSVLQQYQLFT